MTFQFTISRKLLALSLVALLFVVAVGTTGYLAASSLTRATAHIVQDGTALKHQMQADMAHDALRADVLTALHVGMRDSDVALRQQEAVRADLQAHSEQFRTALEQLDKLSLDEDTRYALEQVRPVLDIYVALAARIVAIAFEDKQAALDQMDAFNASFKHVEKEMAELSEQIARRSKVTQEESARTTKLATNGILVAMLLCAVVLLVTSLLIGRNIVSRVRRAVEIAETVARGDLSSRIEVHGSDEAAQLLQALARMNGSLVDLVGTVRVASENIATGSGQISVGNQDLSQRTEEAASNLQATASSMEQLTATVRQSADAAGTANQLAHSATDVAQRGGAVVSEVVRTMDEINASSKKIADIIGVIDGIAFQTNILALNAAVEAARAGEQGRGFAVVAGEVRNLAQRSAEAAKEIKGLIGASVERVESGSKLVADAGATMQEIVSSVQRVSDIIGEISAAASEQSSGIGIVNTSVVQLDAMTQQNAALVEQGAAAADSLKSQAANLAQVVGTFKLVA
jgi:methyl-accepting chemotaxis protein